MAVLRGIAVKLVKDKIEYQSNPITPSCKLCTHLLFDRISDNPSIKGIYHDKFHQCTLNHIAVGKNAVCNQFEAGTPTIVEVV